MVEFTFTGLGSLIHPAAMLILMCCWIGTGVLGFLVRKTRRSPREHEESPLLRTSMHSVLRRKKAHHKLSSSLLLLTVFFTMVAMYNTYLRLGQLFPGPHLYGAFWFILVVSVNVALVPWLATALWLRTVHAGIGLIAALLLANQFLSGIPILVGVWGTVFA